MGTNWSDSDTSSLLHYYANRIHACNQRTPNMASISSEMSNFGNSVPQASFEMTPNLVQNQNFYNPNGLVAPNNNFDMSQQDAFAAAEVVAQIGQMNNNNFNNNSTLSSPVNTPMNAAYSQNNNNNINLIQNPQQSSQTSPIVPSASINNQPTPSSVYNVTNNFYAPGPASNASNVGGYEQNQLVKQPSA